MLVRVLCFTSTSSYYYIPCYYIIITTTFKLYFKRYELLDINQGNLAFYLQKFIKTPRSAFRARYDLMTAILGQHLITLLLGMNIQRYPKFYFITLSRVISSL